MDRSRSGHVLLHDARSAMVCLGVLWDVGASRVHQSWGLGGVALVNLFLISLTSRFYIV